MAGVAEFAWDPETYLQLMAHEVPDYPRLQEQLVTATLERPAFAVLDLGIGSGLTAVRVQAEHRGASLVGIDANADMLAASAASLDSRCSRLYRSHLQDPLPEGPFDLVVSMLAVHHLDGPDKANLFHRVAEVLPDDGRFVLGDLVVPEDSADVVTPIDGIDDVPSSLADQLQWLVDAGLTAEVTWHYRDLAVITSTKAT